MTKTFLFSFFFTLSLQASTICALGNKTFGIEIPDGFAADTDMAEKLKTCLVLYPLGSNPKDSPALLKVSLKPLPHGSSWAKELEKDLHSAPSFKNPRVEIEPDLLNKNGLLFILRRAYNLVADNSVDARAYHEAAGDMLKVTAQIKNPADLSLYEVSEKALIQYIKRLETKDVFAFLKSAAERDAKSPTAQNFNLKYLNSIREVFGAAKTSCGAAKGPSAAAIVISQNGEIMSWFSDVESPYGRCLKKSLLKAHGTKPPYGPFHLVLDLTPVKS